jgi:glycosyltransferase involved in cell wall biosynthesis
MRQAYEVNLLLETGGGGAARHVLDLYRGLKLRGRRVRLILSLRRADPLFQAELATIDADDVYQIDLRRYPSPKDIVAVVKLRNYLHKLPQLQVVHAHSTKAGAIAAMLRSDRTVTLFTPHAYRGMDATLQGYRGVIVRAAEKLLSSAHRKVIAVSPAEFVYARQLGISEEKLSLIENGVDLQKLRELGRRSSRKRANEVCAIGFVGRLVHQKSPLTILKALDVMKGLGFRFHSHIIGDGPLRPSLEEYARDNGLTPYISFYGTVNAIPILANCDVLVHTSIYESLPYSLLEAIALGVPVVAVANAGSEAIFGERIELIKGHLNHVAIADAVMHISRDVAAREKLREIYRDIEDKIGLETMIDKIEAEYGALW